MTFDFLTRPLVAFTFCTLMMGAAATFLSVPATAQVPIISADDSAADEENSESDGNGDDEAATDDSGEDDTADHTDDNVDDDTDGNAGDNTNMPPMPTPDKTGEAAPLPPRSSVIRRSIGQLQATLPDDPQPASANAAMGVQPDDSWPEYVEPVGDTHPALYLTPDKSDIIRLDRPAASIIVGNEAHVNVLIDTPYTLLAVPRMPGASYFTVLDQHSRIIMQRHVVVGAAEQYVRVRRSCRGASSGCETTSVFYCPEGMCHQVTTQQRAEPAIRQPGMRAVRGGDAALGGGDDYEGVPDETPQQDEGPPPGFYNEIMRRLLEP